MPYKRVKNHNDGTFLVSVLDAQIQKSQQRIQYWTEDRLTEELHSLCWHSRNYRHGILLIHALPLPQKDITSEEDHRKHDCANGALRADSDLHLRRYRFM